MNSAMLKPANQNWLRIISFGGCMLASAMAEPIRQLAVRNTFVIMGHDWPTCYSVQEALRTVQFYRGDVDIPESLRHLCALPVNFDPRSDRGSRFEDADVVLLEPNTSLYHLFRGIPITRTEIDRHILYPLRAIKGDVEKAAVTWFGRGLLECNEQAQLEAAAVLVPYLEGRVPDPALAREVLLETRSVLPDRQAYIAAIAEFRDMIRKPLGIVTFTYQYLPNGRGLAWPADFVEATIEAAEQLDLPYIHPAELVRKYGAKLALQNDLRLYRPEFESYIGEKMLAFCRALATEKTEAIDAAPRVQASGAAAPATSLRDAYSEAALRDQPPLAYADMISSLRQWATVRATLSETVIETPLPNVRARKLVEAITLSEQTHDIRADISNPADGKKFRMALVVRSEERTQVRFWLGNSGGVDRVDVTFDLTTGMPLAGYSVNSNWHLVDVGSEAIGGSWHICWIVAEAKRSVPELFVLITTSAGRAGLMPVGDGKSGLWIGGLRVDIVDDCDPFREDAARRPDDNRRDLADIVSEEILAYLKEEYEASGDLYQWYRTRYLPNNIGLSRIDREIASFVLRRFGATRKTVEIGAGIGQCSQLLALCGVQAIGVEASFAHFEMMRRLTDRLSARFDLTLPQRLQPLRGFYPDDVGPYIDGQTIVIVPSVGSSLTPEQEIKVFDALRPADGVILGVRAFFRVRETEEERETMVEEIQKRGFGNPEVVFEWKDHSFGFVPDRIIFFPRVR